MCEPATPQELSNNSWVGRGVFNRIRGLEYVRRNAEPDSVLFFADDDNTYDVRVFEEMRRMARDAAVWPVGLVLNLGVSSPIVVDGRVVGFHDAFQAGRTFAVDMAGFAVNTDRVKASPNVTIPWRVSYLEDGFLRSLGLTKADLEPLANDCKEVLVWHTKTSNAAKVDMKNVEELRLPEGVSHFSETNLEDLYASLVIR